MSMAEPERADEDGVEVECHNCGYIWTYKRDMWTATCPNCNTKTATGLGPDESEEEAFVRGGNKDENDG